MPQTAEMERAYLKGDASYNGVFFLGVRTTGIFCRPTCPARKPLPKSVEYFPTTRAALAAGYIFRKSRTPRCTAFRAGILKGWKS